jgi:hypothetical protein
MGSGSTTLRARPYPLSTDAPTVSSDLEALAVNLDTVADNGSGTTLPVSGMVIGDEFFLTTTSVWYKYNGSGWQFQNLRQVTTGTGSGGFNSASPASSCSGTITHGLPAAPSMVKFTPINDPASGTYTGGSPLTIIWTSSTSTTFSWEAIIAGVSNNTLSFAWEATA